jgi:hypothetical protein
MRAPVRIITSLVATIGISEAFAQPLPLGELFRLHTTTIVGAESPANIPQAVTIREFSIAVEGVEVGDSDASMLRTWATELDQLLQEHGKVAEEEHREVCALLKANEVDALEVYAIANGLDAERDAAVLASFNPVYERLSEPGKRAVDGFIATQIVPRIQHTVTDHVAIATIDNEGATAQLALTCTVKLTFSPDQMRRLAQAKSPDEIRQLIEEAKQAPYDGDSNRALGDSNLRSEDELAPQSQSSSAGAEIVDD